VSVDSKQNKYLDLNPYNYVKNNPIKYIDPDGKEIINADKLRRERQEEIVKGMETSFKYLEDKYGSLTKRKEFNGSKEEWKRAKEFVSKFTGAKKGLEQLKENEKITEQLIIDWEKKSPNLFNRINTLENEAGEPVHMMFGVKNLFDKGQDQMYGGHNEKPEFEEIDQVMRPYSEEFGMNTITVFVEKDRVDREYFEKDTGQDIENHEAGHFEYMVTHSREYDSFIKELENAHKDLQGGHTKDDKSGKLARKYGRIKDIEE
jgi:hypothetical protein